jgi:hypothetical protein
MTYALKADGSHVIGVERLDRAWPTAQRLLMMTIGRRIDVNDITERRSTTEISANTVLRSVRDPQSRCINSLLGEPFAANERLDNLVTIRGHRTAQISRGNATVWYSLDCGCVELQSRSTRGTYVHDLESCSVGEPDAALFNVPASYLESPPSRLHSDRRPVSRPQADDYYQRYRVR